MNEVYIDLEKRVEDTPYRPIGIFWYKYVFERNMWRISLDEDDRGCSVWLFECGKYSLNEAIDCILKNPDFQVGVYAGYEVPEKTFTDFYEVLKKKYGDR